MGDSGLDRLAGRLQTNLPRFRRLDRTAASFASPPLNPDVRWSGGPNE